MRLLPVAVCLFLMSLSALAQDKLGAITGVITDWEHTTLSNAPVQAKNTATGAVYKAVSSATGEYTLAQLPAGTYELTVAVPGLLRYQKKDIAVQAGQKTRLDVRVEELGALGTVGEDRYYRAGLELPHPTPSGPTPHTPDGKPDLSGVWWPMRETDPEPPSLLPWAAAEAKKRSEENGKDAPRAHCLPDVVTLLGRFEFSKFIQTPALLIVFNQSDVPGYRQVFLDGRQHPKDLDPSWHGHSLGKWDGDTLVVDTVGLNDRSWLNGSVAANVPHTEKLHVTERVRRTDLGHLEVEVTYDDPGAFAKPWKLKGIADLAENEEIEEGICNENNQDVEHMVGK